MQIVLIAMVACALFCGCTQMGGGASERGDLVTLKGTPVTLLGANLSVGDTAPPFAAVDAGYQKVALSDFAGRPVLISAVPSLDTPVCSLQTGRFNDEVKNLPAQAVVLTISRDLPFAQKRFCTAEGVDKTIVLSDAARLEFGEAYGVLIKDMGLLARAIFVIDTEGKIAYMEIVPEVATHPDYEAALKAVKAAAK